MKVFCFGKNVVFPANKKSEVAASAFHWWFLNYQDVLKKRFEGHFEFVVSKRRYIIRCPSAEIARKLKNEARN